MTAAILNETHLQPLVLEVVSVIHISCNLLPSQPRLEHSSACRCTGTYSGFSTRSADNTPLQH